MLKLNVPSFVYERFMLRVNIVNETSVVGERAFGESSGSIERLRSIDLSLVFFLLFSYALSEFIN